MRVLYIVAGILVAALIGAAAYVLVLGGDSESGATPEAVLTDEAEIDSMATGYVNPPFKDNYDMLRISGYVDNTSDSTIQLAIVEIQLLAGDGGKKELVTFELGPIPPQSRKTYDANAGPIGEDRTAEIDIVELQIGG